MTAIDAPASSSKFMLRSTCPPGFELMPDNGCELRSLYQFYSSIQNRGLGGTRTGLPPYRDGFTPQQIDLGRHLFFDPLLSADGSISCGSCHHPEQGFADGRATSTGINGHTTQRSAPTLWNSAFANRYFWDARATSLEEQASGPLYSKFEMGNTREQLLSSLNDNHSYRRMFNQAFNQQGSANITLDQIYTSLAAFQSSLISLNSRYDQYAHGNQQALNDEELAGLNVFRSFVARCSECHTPPLFTNNQIAVTGAPEPANKPLDVGAEKTFGSARLKGGFKVPTLRNIAKTAPYMHSGVFATLYEATEFYNKGRGHALAEGVDMLLHWHIAEPDLQDHELDLLVAFMKTLNDETFSPQVPVRVPSGLSVQKALRGSITHKSSNQENQ